VAVSVASLDIPVGKFKLGIMLSVGWTKVLPVERRLVGKRWRKSTTFPPRPFIDAPKKAGPNGFAPGSMMFVDFATSQVGEEIRIGRGVFKTPLILRASPTAPPPPLFGFAYDCVRFTQTISSVEKNMAVYRSDGEKIVDIANLADLKDPEFCSQLPTNEKLFIRNPNDPPEVSFPVWRPGYTMETTFIGK
jgi:hypothetical protein